MSGISDAITTASNIAKDSINPVNVKPSIITGIAVTIIIFGLIFKYMSNNKGVYLLDAAGCILDADGVRIKDPIYQSNNNGNNSPVIIGYKECSKPLSASSKYGILLVGSMISGLIAGSVVYNMMFKIANPKLAAAGHFYTSTFR
jgi:hypothetical protein